MNSSVCVLAMGAFLPPPSLFSASPPHLLLVFPRGLYIYEGQLQAPIVPPSKLGDRCPAPLEGSPQSQEEGAYWQFQKANRYQRSRGPADKVAITLLWSLLLPPRVFLQFACCQSGAEL